MENFTTAFWPAQSPPPPPPPRSLSQRRRPSRWQSSLWNLAQSRTRSSNCWSIAQVTGWELKGQSPLSAPSAAAWQEAPSAHQRQMIITIFKHGLRSYCYSPRFNSMVCAIAVPASIKLLGAL